MTKPFSRAIFSIVVCALSTPVWSQKVYRCGDTYSQTPCANAVEIGTEDRRSPEQKSQATKTAERDKATADAMEKKRVAEDGRAQSQNASLTKDRKAPPEKASKPDPKKKNTPEFFTAKAASEKTKNPAKSGN